PPDPTPAEVLPAGDGRLRPDVHREADPGAADPLPDRRRGAAGLTNAHPRPASVASLRAGRDRRPVERLPGRPLLSPPPRHPGVSVRPRAGGPRAPDRPAHGAAGGGRRPPPRRRLPPGRAR